LFQIRTFVSDPILPIEVSYYSSELFKEALCFNCGLECEEHINYGEYIVKNATH